MLLFPIAIRKGGRELGLKKYKTDINKLKQAQLNHPDAEALDQG